MLGFGEWEANFMLTVNDVHIFASLVLFFFLRRRVPPLTPCTRFLRHCIFKPLLSSRSVFSPSAQSKVEEPDCLFISVLRRASNKGYMTARDTGRPCQTLSHTKQAKVRFTFIVLFLLPTKFSTGATVKVTFQTQNFSLIQIAHYPCE